MIYAVLSILAIVGWFLWWNAWAALQMNRKAATNTLRDLRAVRACADESNAARMELEAMLRKVRSWAHKSVRELDADIEGALK